MLPPAWEGKGDVVSVLFSGRTGTAPYRAHSTLWQRKARDGKAPRLESKFNLTKFRQTKWVGEAAFQGIILKISLGLTFLDSSCFLNRILLLPQPPPLLCKP